MIHDARLPADLPMKLGTAETEEPMSSTYQQLVQLQATCDAILAAIQALPGGDNQAVLDAIAAVSAKVDADTAIDRADAATDAAVLADLTQ